jgi:hemerythrin-like domain-containing protein
VCDWHAIEVRRCVCWPVSETKMGNVGVACRSSAMTKVIEQLRRDHRNMRQLLDIIEREMKAYHDDQSPDFDLLRMIAEYAVNYPELVHHPKEHLIYRRLASHDPTLRAAAGNLMCQHEKLAAMTRRLSSVITRMASDEELQRVVRAYLTVSRDHIMMEEEKVYPRALALLTRQDWSDIDDQAAKLEDPAFGRKVAAAYLYLHKRITEDLPC